MGEKSRFVLATDEQGQEAAYGVPTPVAELVDQLTDQVDALRALERSGEQTAIRMERRRRHARRVLDAEERAENAAEFRDQIPDLISLTELLAEPDEDARYVVDGLLPVGGRAVIAAARKGGKTTLTGNLCRSFADQAPFLDRFGVEARTVTVVDVEMARGQTRRWLRDQGIKHADAVRVIPLRGKASTFNILDDATRTIWAEILDGSDVIILDCLRPVLDALGLNEHTDAGEFLVAFDGLLAEAGVSEAVVVHHAGHGNDRARGDSRIEDWPDAIWYLGTEDRKDLSSPRTFSAIGRDVDLAKGALEFDPESRHLTFIAPAVDAVKSAKAAEAAEARRVTWSAVHEWIRDQNAAGVQPSKGDTRKRVLAKHGKPVTRDLIDDVLESALQRGTITVRAVGNGQYLTAVDPTVAVPLRPVNPFSIEQESDAAEAVKIDA